MLIFSFYRPGSLNKNSIIHNFIPLETEKNKGNVSVYAQIRAQQDVMQEDKKILPNDQSSEGEYSEESIQLYSSQIKQIIEFYKNYPRMEKNLGREGFVKISFTIFPDGSIANLNLIQPNVYEGFNQATIRTVQKAQPFPPFPSEIHLDSLLFEFDIEYSLK